MGTEDFFTKILPKTGVYFLATPMSAPYTGFKHYAYTTIPDLVVGVRSLVAAGQTVFHACASYNEPFVEVTDAAGKIKRSYRKHTNVKSISSFWFDLDCGEGKPYATQQDAAQALLEFLKATGLPDPVIISSGNGLHVYWPYGVDLVVNQWSQAARLLKNTMLAYGLHPDPERTADPSSILRPVGALHRKGTPKPVVCLRDAPTVDLNTFLKLLVQAAKVKGVKQTKSRQHTVSLNADLSIQQEPSSAILIASKCQQIAQIRDTQGNVPEPLWYGGIGVLRFCEEGPALIHQWSSGYIGYTAEETDEKIQHHIDSGVGPTTCAKFDSTNPGVCINCPVWQKITSPIQLGRVIPASVPQQIQLGSQTITLPPPPKPYIILPKGGVGYLDADGLVCAICEYGVVPIRRVFDMDAKQSTVTLRVTYPTDATREFDVFAATLSSTDFGKSMASKELYLGAKNMAQLQAYILDYLREVQKASASVQLHSHMGWKEDFSRFVSGPTVYHSDGVVDELPANLRSNSGLSGFGAVGDLDKWKQVAEAYNQPGMEAYQFGLLSAFGAPLMPFSGYSGALVSLISSSGGQGKSTIQNVISSVWGNPKELELIANDKVLPLMQRIAKYCNLPVTLDELTMKPVEWLSELAFQVTQGRERLRLNPDASEKLNVARWSTLVITSSNSSLIHKLTGVRANSEAEALRVFEVSVLNRGQIPKINADNLFGLIKNNYGVAGDVYMRYVVTHVEEIKQLYTQIKERLDKATNAKSSERYWIAVATVNMVGGLIAKKLGLINYDMRAQFIWMQRAIGEMRAMLNDNTRDNLAVLSAFVSENMGNRLFTNHDGRAKQGGVVNMVEPRGPLRLRMIESTGTMLIPKALLKAYMVQNGGDMNELRRELTSIGALVHHSIKRDIGQGTNYTTVQTDCIELNYVKLGLSSLTNAAGLSLVGGT